MDYNDIVETNLTNLTKIFEMYKDNEYMVQRINNHIRTILPNTLETEYENYNERLIRNNTLLVDQETFIKVFLSKNQYFYLNSTNCFYEYVDSKYKIVKEDDIHYKLLSNITENKKIMDWKHKTKLNIIKQIRDRHLFKSVPDTMTIQNVLNMLYPAFFPSKSATKYFLTIIGDNLLKKSTSIKIINKQISIFNQLDMIGCNSIIHNFISKYHENHNYNMYRLLSINDEYSNDIWKSIVKQLGLDLLCVASHYSNRYENSENYIINCSDTVLKNHALYFKTNTQMQIVDQFISNSLEKVEDPTFTISWKNLHYIWKLYLSSIKLPNMIYSNSLKQYLKQQFEYDEVTDMFYKITSKFLPCISDFLFFWESYILVHQSKNITDFVEELEINELYELFKKIFPTTTISEKDVLKLMTHFFTDINIIENKYILNVSSSILLWNKNANIMESLDVYKNCDNSTTTTNNNGIISFDDLYQNYIKYCHEKHFLIVNKKYFEKYVGYKLKDFVVFDTFIGSDWIIT
jgi:hypothetical protein